MTTLFRHERSKSPLLVSVPHAGTCLPDEIKRRLAAPGLALEDTDWFVDCLYDWVPETGAGLLVANYSRYVVDLNRPPDNAALYASPTPGLIPEVTFAGEPIYQDQSPGEPEVKDRMTRYWQPYHAMLRSELDRIRAKFGYAILFDAHSIRSHVPALFDGRLPDLNLGTYDGRSAGVGLVKVAARVFSEHAHYSSVIDGRFKGGYITRHYGDPANHVHSLQLEMAQSVYMQEDPPRYDPKLAGGVQDLLKNLLSALVDWKPAE